MTGWTDLIGWTLLHFVWEGTLITLSTALILTLLRHGSAQVRYVVACAGLLASLLAVVTTPAALLWVDGRPELVETRDAERRRLAPDPAPSRPPQMQILAAPSTAAASGAQTNGIVSTLVIGWAAGVLLLTVRLGVAWWRVRRLQLRALAAPGSAWLSTATRLARRLHLSRAVHVIDSGFVDSPTVVGWLRPVILLPVAALANLTPGQVEAILAHELAHVRRHDFLVNVLQAIAETLLFYHPGVWWLSSRIRTEREHCCDDIAVEVCGDPVGYAEALTTIATWARDRIDVAAGGAPSPLAMAVTGGSLLCRVRRLLHLPADGGRRQPRAPFVFAATLALIVIVGARLLLVAQTPASADPSIPAPRLGPNDVNRLVGFDLFPGPAHYAGDDPSDARAWDVEVNYPGGHMAFLGFTGRSLIRYAYDLDTVPVVDGPSWIDTEPIELRADTSAEVPTDFEYREAIRVALEARFHVSIRTEPRLFPVYGLQPNRRGALGPNLRPAAVDCVEDIRTHRDLMGPSLHARGEVLVPFCGIDHTIWGPRGYRVTLAQFARSLRGFGMIADDRGDVAREVVDQTGLTGVYDFELNLGFLPLAAIATAHPTMALGLGPLVRTFPQAIDEQLGLRLVPSEQPRDVVVVTAAEQAWRQPPAGPEQLAALRNAR